MKRRIMALFTSVVLALCLASCGEKTKESEMQPAQTDAKEESEDLLMTEQEEATVSAPVTESIDYTDEDLFEVAEDPETGGVKVGMPWTGSKDYTEIIIPPSIHGVPVTGIANAGFRTFENLKRVVLPDSIVSIGDNAFDGCINLTDLVIPDGVVSIGCTAFAHCPFTEIEFPDSVKEIGSLAFLDCNQLSKVKLPDDLDHFEYLTFNNCGKLKRIRWRGKRYEDMGEVIDMITRYLAKEKPYPEPKALHLNIPVTSEAAFLYEDVDLGVMITGLNEGYKELTEICIPDTIGGKPVVSIGGSYWIDMFHVHSLKLGKHMTRIGEGAFQDCWGLKEVELPDGLTEIEGNAFANCGLKEIYLPDSIVSVGDFAFSGCSRLIAARIPSGVKLGDRTFAQCMGMRNIEIPDDVDISSTTFDECFDLRNITWKGNDYSRVDEFMEAFSAR